MTEERLNDLLLAWQEQHRQGRDTPAAELCCDCPELAGELARRIDVVRQMVRLVEAAGTVEATLRPPSPRASPSLLPSSVPGYEILEELGRGGQPGAPSEAAAPECRRRSRANAICSTSYNRLQAEGLVGRGVRRGTLGEVERGQEVTYVGAA
jgi:hypothetical protein